MEVIARRSLGVSTSCSRLGNTACARFDGSTVSVLTEHRLAVVVSSLQGHDNDGSSIIGGGDPEASISLLVPSPSGLGPPSAQTWSSDGLLLAIAFDRLIVVLSSVGADKDSIDMTFCTANMRSVLELNSAFQVRDIACCSVVQRPSGYDCYHIAAAGARGVKVVLVERRKGVWSAVAPSVFLAQGYSICSVRFSPAGRWLFLGANDGHIGVWDARRLGKRSSPHMAIWRDTIDVKGCRITDACFSQDEQVLCLATLREGIFVYTCASDSGSFRLLTRLGQDTNTKNANIRSSPFVCAFSPHSRFLAFSCGTSVHVVFVGSWSVNAVCSLVCHDVTGLACLGNQTLFAVDYEGRYSIFRWPDKNSDQGLPLLYKSENEAPTPVLHDLKSRATVISAANAGLLAVCAQGALHICWTPSNKWRTVFARFEAFCFFPPSDTSTRTHGLLVRCERSSADSCTLRLSYCVIAISVNQNEIAVAPTRRWEVNLDVKDNTEDNSPTLAALPGATTHIGVYINKTLREQISVDE